MERIYKNIILYGKWERIEEEFKKDLFLRKILMKAIDQQRNYYASSWTHDGGKVEDIPLYREEVSETFDKELGAELLLRNSPNTLMILNKLLSETERQKALNDLRK